MHTALTPALPRGPAGPRRRAPAPSSRWPAVVAATSLHTHDELCWRLRSAPNPDEVIWRALRLRLWERR
jgi:hypothetical protein